MNNFGLRFDPVFSIWAIAAIVLALFGYFIWKETQRNQKFLKWRILAQSFMFLSVIGLVMRPTYSAELTSSEHLLLTPGYERAKVDSLLKAHPTLEIIRTPEAESYAPNERVVDHPEIAEKSSSLNFVVGEGLPPAILEMADSNHFEFLPRRLPTGVMQLRVPGHIEINHRNYIQGLFQTDGNTMLSLHDPQGIVDSVMLQGPGLIPFTLSFIPKIKGRFLYTLNARDNEQNIISEKLPVEVHEQRPLRILFLQKYPTAETRYLKNFLIKEGNALALRYQTSRTNFSYEYGNHPAIRIDRLSSSLLESFELVFIDAKVLNELNNTEASALKNAIQAGLGIIIFLDEIPKKGTVMHPLLSITTQPALKDTVQIRFFNSQRRTLPFLPLLIPPAQGIYPITTSQGKILSGYVYAGAGKVGFQLLQETYRLQLEAHTDYYAVLWSPLIENTARRMNEMYRLQLATPFPYFINDPLKVEVISSGNHPALLTDNVLLPLTEDVVVDDLWYGKTWAGAYGWHELSIERDSATLSYFVSEKGRWNALRVANQIKANTLNTNPQLESGAHGHFQEKPIPGFLFFLIFLASAGFLWLAPKI